MSSIAGMSVTSGSIPCERCGREIKRRGLVLGRVWTISVGPLQGKKVCDECHNQIKAELEKSPESPEQQQTTPIVADTSSPNQAGAPLSDRFGDQKTLSAAEIVRNPEEAIKRIRGRYQTVFDQSVAGLKWDNFDRALKIMGEAGWRVVAISTLTADIGLGQTRWIYGVLERV